MLFARRMQRRIGQCSVLIKIVVALALALSMVVGIYSYLVFRMQGRWMQDRRDALGTIVSLSVQEQFSRSLIGGIKAGKHPPAKLNFDRAGPDVWVVDPEQRIVSSTMPGQAGMAWRKNAGGGGLVMRLPNHGECRSCHEGGQSQLGEIRTGPAPMLASSEWQMQWILFYGVMMTVLILVGMVFCFVRFVRQPLALLLRLMHRAQGGDLSVRFPVRSRDETAQLGHGFNRMIHSLAKAQSSLQIAHDRQIQQAEKLASVGELASSMAHEIRNPLAGIRTAVQVLSEKIAPGNGNQIMREIVDEVVLQTDRIQRIVSDMLQYVRPKPPKKVPCNLRDLVERCVKFVGPQAGKHHVRIDVRCAAEEFEVHADPAQIQQAILNLVLNAIEAMKTGGELAIAMVEGEGECVLTIRDTGPGIPREVQPRIFSPFFTTKQHGTGLGLSITRGIIQQHGGRLEFKSEPGRGTQFRVFFPILESAGSSWGGFSEDSRREMVVQKEGL